MYAQAQGVHRTHTVSATGIVSFDPPIMGLILRQLLLKYDFQQLFNNG
jgi:hypothetical protein